MFLFVGRMIEYKGQRLILDALKGLFDENVDFRMLFVGDGADLETLKAYSESLGMAEKVIFTGAIRNREEIRALYGFADLFLFPSTYDTNGLVVTEAAGSGTASVLVRGSAAAENITDGRNGFLINETAVSLFATLWKLTQHPEKMKEAGEHALEEVYFSWDDAVKAAYKRYDYLIHSYKTGFLPRRKEDFADLVLANDGRFAQTILDVRDFFQNAAETLFR